MSRYAVHLNNYLQARQQTHVLHWGEEFGGPANNKVWTMTCYIEREVYGVGIHAQKGMAKNLAAKEALQKLGVPDQD